MMAVFRVEVTQFEDGETAREAFFYTDQTIAKAVYDALKRDVTGKVRGVFLDRLAVANEAELAAALNGAQLSRYEIRGLTPILKTAEAF
jgi:hypothetical protein